MDDLERKIELRIADELEKHKILGVNQALHIASVKLAHDFQSLIDAERARCEKHFRNEIEINKQELDASYKRGVKETLEEIKAIIKDEYDEIFIEQEGFLQRLEQLNQTHREDTK